MLACKASHKKNDDDDADADADETQVAQSAYILIECNRGHSPKHPEQKCTEDAADT